MVRKTVTLVFCDVADSTPLGEQLDPEALRGVWSRYHETAREVLERHGGTIEKFVGDAVLGVFGIPVVHEDDALRAVRAAVELREELARLNDELDAAFGVRIGVRTGVHTGEVFAGDPAQGDPFATGDAVVVAQRLEATAAPGEILVGDATIRLVRDAVTAEPVPALELKGKSEPVDAWRLLDVEPDAAGLARRMDSPLVGRAAELDALLAELDRAIADRACRDRHDRRRAGSGQVAARGGARRDRRGATRSCSRAAASRTATGSRTGRSSRSSASSTSTRSSAASPTARRRTAASSRRSAAPSRARAATSSTGRSAGCCETLAREQPLVLVLDDIQWAEPAFLDLVEYLAGWSRDAPILVCCLARPDLAELRPALGGRRRSSSRRCRSSRRGRCSRISPGRSTRTRPTRSSRATGGNPLFLEEMLRMLVEDGVLVERDGRLRAARRGRLAARARDGAGGARGPPRPARARTSWRCCSARP